MGVGQGLVGSGRSQRAAANLAVQRVFDGDHLRKEGRGDERSLAVGALWWDVTGPVAMAAMVARVDGGGVFPCLC